MINLKAEARTKKEGRIPVVLYGPKRKNINLEVNLKEFNNVYKEAGESTLITLFFEKDKSLVLIHDVSFDPLNNTPIHVDFYEPILNKAVEAEVPLIFEGESPAVKNLGGTIIKEIQELEVKALPQKLPHEIKVDISCLETFEDEITVKDLKVDKDVKIMRDPDDVVANVQPPQKIEEELEKPIEENVEGVEKIVKEKIQEDDKEE